MSETAPYWLVMPAAGLGARMQADRPKQYLPLAGRRVIDWSLTPFIDDARCRGAIVALAADDTFWPTCVFARHAKVHTTTGGADRAASVLAGLQALLAHGVSREDWVLVHDAARPCLASTDLDALLVSRVDEAVGALLAIPVTDTLKRAQALSPSPSSSPSLSPRAEATLSREKIWRALTPQLFRVGLLLDALEQARANKLRVTDESAAVEAMQLQPRLIAGRADNIKITVAADLPLAERILRERQACLSGQ